MPQTTWIDQNAHLLRALARRVGVTFETLPRDDLRLNDLAYRKAVLSCAGCMEKDLCALIAQSDAVLLKSPDFCRNNTLLDMLAGRGTPAADHSGA